MQVYKVLLALLVAAGTLAQAQTFEEEFDKANCRMRSYITGQRIWTPEQEPVTAKSCWRSNHFSALVASILKETHPDRIVVGDLTEFEDRGIVEYRKDPTKQFKSCEYHIEKGQKISASLKALIEKLEKTEEEIEKMFDEIEAQFVDFKCDTV